MLGDWNDETSLVAAFGAVAALTNPAQAADLGGDCCADLEERMAELEATTARKGNRKVSLTIAGHVNKAVLFWDDGFEDNAYVVGNKNDQTNISFTGEAEISKGWKAGYDITIRFRTRSPTLSIRTTTTATRASSSGSRTGGWRARSSARSRSVSRRG